MNNLFHELEFVCCHINDLLVINKGNFGDHVRKLEQVFAKLRAAGLQVNPTKSFWAKPECECLGCTMSKNGIEPQPKKAKAILEISPPANLKQLRRFIGLINHHRDVWPKRSHFNGTFDSSSKEKCPMQIWTKTTHGFQ